LCGIFGVFSPNEGIWGENPENPSFGEKTPNEGISRWQVVPVVLFS
jgi:hypothetical protein